MNNYTYNLESYTRKGVIRMVQKYAAWTDIHEQIHLQLINALGLQNEG